MEKVDLFQIERIAESQKKAAKINWRDGQKELICSLYVDDCCSIRDICSMFGGIHKNTVKKVLEENGITIRTGSASHFKDKRNLNIFEKIDTEEKAYWLGFLFADGGIVGNYVVIALQGRDIEHLEKFKKFLGADTAKIYQYEREGRPYCRISIGCKKMVEDLAKYGCVQKKSLILKPPIELVPEEFYYDFLRGYFDGDGCLSYSVENNRWQSNVIGTNEMMTWVCQVLNLNTAPKHDENKYGNHNVWTVHFNGRFNVARAWDKLERNGNAKVYLTRKYDLYKQLCSSFIKCGEPVNAGCLEKG